MPQRTLKEFADAYRMFTSTFTKEEFINAFKEVMAVVVAMKKRNEEEMRQMEAMHEEMMRKLEGGNSEMIESAMQEMKKKMMDMMEPMMEKMYTEHEEMMKRMSRQMSEMQSENLKALKEQHEGMKFIYDKVQTMKSGEKGKDADEEKIVEKVLEKLPKKDFDFESLKTEIKDTLKNEIENIRKVLQNIPRGGGTSAIGVAQTFKWIAHTEQPTGDINGVNTAYTVKNNIWWIAGFTLNGEQIAQLPNFTYTGRTITFTSAIPAAYSGKDFEIKYIGT